MKVDIDKLLDVYVEGIYAMDPKTALPFWDYDFGPVFGDLWIAKMLAACRLANKQNLSPATLAECFANIAVPRKEVIYALADLKVGKVPLNDRLFYVDFWWKVVESMCQRDCLVQRANIVHTDDEVERLIRDLPWSQADVATARQVGNLAMNLNSLAYGLYTDIFAHNSMENFGAYDVSRHFGGSKHILVVKQWANLKPIELFPEMADFRADRIRVYAVYRDIDYTVDIYTHQTYSGNAAQHLVQYCVEIDDQAGANDLANLRALNDDLGQRVVTLFGALRSRGFEEAKKMWVLARNYQFKEFFALVGMDWYDQPMLERVGGKELVKTDYWDFAKYDRQTLFAAWRQFFDPRLDTYFEDWGDILRREAAKRKDSHD